MKFAANFDNQINRRLVEQSVFNADVVYENQLSFVFEGGSIESDGEGTLLTTSDCLLSPNRNDGMSKAQIEAHLLACFGADRVLWLDNGYLEGDDTDSHIDTLARLCSPSSIAYVQCTDTNDVHFEALRKMEEELQNFRTAQGKPYELIALPMTPALYYEGDRLPATYANFLIVNGAVLVPTYGLSTDAQALSQMSIAFPNHEIVPIRCEVLVKQHGSLHCVTMQFPAGVLSKN
jgi:agmatine/peptidylarginine deiminase